MSDIFNGIGIKILTGYGDGLEGTPAAPLCHRTIARGLDGTGRVRVG